MYFLVFIIDRTAGDSINEEKCIKNSHFQGKPEDFIQGNKVQQAKGYPYNLYNSSRDNGSGRDSYSH